MRKGVKERLYSMTTRAPDGCLLFTGMRWPAAGLYGAIKVGGRRRLAHRVAYEIHHGPIPEGMAVCHKCDVRFCVEPAHLFIGTRADNSRDMVNKGRQAKGASQGSAKLTPEIVEYIRKVSVPGHPQFGRAALGRRFGVKPGCISKIANGQRWAANESRRVQVSSLRK